MADGLAQRGPRPGTGWQHSCAYTLPDIDMCIPEKLYLDFIIVQIRNLPIIASERLIAFKYGTLY